MRDIIPADYTRCSNYECSQRFQCKRALQLDIDQVNTNPHPRGYGICRLEEKDCVNRIL